MSNTSIGRGPAAGGNENHDGDPCNKTLGEAVTQERPSGSVVPEPLPTESDRNHQPQPSLPERPPS